MNRFVWLSCVALALIGCCLVASAANSNSESPVPFVMWSPSSKLGEVSRVVEERSWLSTVQSKLDNILSHDQPLIVAFIYPTLNSAQFSAFETRFSQIKSHVEQATSSISIGQLMTSNRGVSTMLRSLVSGNAHPLTRVQTFTVDDQSCASILNNMRIASDNLIIFSYPESTDLSVQDQCTEQILQSVQASTFGHYVAIVSADSASSIRMNFNNEFYSYTPDLNMKLQTVFINGTKPTFSGVQYITPVMLFAIMFGLFFLLALYCGVSCLNSIQTPLRFPSRKLPVGKEF